jgi:hypothetical protein
MYAEHYIFCGFQVSEFQVSGNLETSGNQQKPGNNLHVLLMQSQHRKILQPVALYCQISGIVMPKF